MTRGRFAAALLSAWTCSACVVAPPSMHPVVDPSIPVAVAGYAVMPPSGPGWLRAGFGPGATYIRKIAQDHTVVAQAAPFPLEGTALGQDFVQSVRTRNATRLIPGRNELKRSKYDKGSVNGLDCIRYELEIIDTGVRSDGSPFPLKVLGSVCRRNDSDSSAIDVLFSERGGPPDFTPELRKTGEEFLASVKG